MQEILDVLSISLNQGLKAEIKQEGSNFYITFSDEQKFKILVKAI